MMIHIYTHTHTHTHTKLIVTYKEHGISCLMPTSFFPHLT